MTSHSRIRVLSVLTLGATLSFAVLAGVLSCRHLGAAEEPGKDKEDEARREQQLKNMKRSAAQYAVAHKEDRQQPFKFHQNPVLRFSNPVLGTRDGALYVWSDHGRPQAVLKLITPDNETFNHEWQSLSERTLIAERHGKTVWSPTEPGVTFREMADTPKPAESAAARLRQMKSLAAQFSSTYDSYRPGSNKPVELRLLIQPLLRVEADEKTKCSDGALFAFAEGTAPLGLLLLEARATAAGPRWYYAFARMGSGAVTAKYQDKEIFSVKGNYNTRDPKQTFWILRGQPVPEE